MHGFEDQPHSLAPSDFRTSASSGREAFALKRPSDVSFAALLFDCPGARTTIFPRVKLTNQSHLDQPLAMWHCTSPSWGMAELWPALFKPPSQAMSAPRSACKGSSNYLDICMLYLSCIELKPSHLLQAFFWPYICLKTILFSRSDDNRLACEAWIPASCTTPAILLFTPASSGRALPLLSLLCLLMHCIYNFNPVGL